MRVNGIGLYSRFVCFIKWLPLALVAVGALMGCAGPSGRHWGFDAPTLQRIGKAAVRAATSPTVWGPTAGALVFTIDDWDEKVSAWAAENTPLFGSESRAAHASDLLRGIAVGTAAVAAVATPTGPDGSYALSNKLWDIGLGVGAVAVTSVVTESLKNVTNRDRQTARTPAVSLRSCVDSRRHIDPGITIRRLLSIPGLGHAQPQRRLANAALRDGVGAD